MGAERRMQISGLYGGKADVLFRKKYQIKKKMIEWCQIKRR